MAQLWKGLPAATALSEKTAAQAAVLKEKGISPTLAIVRVGERPEDLAYERGALKRCEKVGVAVQQFILPPSVTQMELLSVIQTINGDERIHGCLLLRPLPAHLNEEAICEALSPAKDVDGITRTSMAAVFTGSGTGFAPCTAQACLELLDHYHYDLQGRHAVVVGRSLVIGKPVSMLLLSRHATVTICHSRSRELPALCREADLLILAAGKARLIGAESARPGQVVIDVGINAAEDGSLIGDGDFDALSPVVEAITPVPGGVGAVTTSVLANHVVLAAALSCNLSLDGN